MKLLLDTHTFIWWDSEPTRISPAALSLLVQPENEILLSLVSLWEIQIKAQLGRLELRIPLVDITLRQQLDNGLLLLPIVLEHILELDNLPWHHKDPFDRMLIAQGRTEGATLISCDAAFGSYDCQVIW